MLNLRQVFFMALFSLSAWALPAQDREGDLVEEIAIFKKIMIERECRFASTDEGALVQEETQLSDQKFSAVMMSLAISGQLICVAGCQLIAPECS